MALTSQQNIPQQPQIREPWTLKKLLPFTGLTTSLTKAFVNPLDILLGYLIFIIGIAELIGRNISWMLWIFTILILIADVFERHAGILLDHKQDDKKENGK